MKKLAFIFFLIFCFSIEASTQDLPSIPSNEKEYNIQYQKNIKKSRINGVYIPKDLDDVFKELSMLAGAEPLIKFKSAPEDVVASKLHFGLGRWMISNWNFYGGSRISHLLKEMGVSFPDDMAQFLIISFHRHLNESPLESEALAQTYKQQRLDEQLARENAGSVIKEETRIRKN